MNITRTRSTRSNFSVLTQVQATCSLFELWQDQVMSVDYRKFYNLEQYLFTEVRERFINTGKILPVDFYLILIWKANRTKTRIRNRLSKRTGRLLCSGGASDSLANPKREPEAKS